MIAVRMLMSNFFTGSMQYIVIILIGDYENNYQRINKVHKIESDSKGSGTNSPGNIISYYLLQPVNISLIAYRYNQWVQIFPTLSTKESN